jgi:hypothetical protein
VTVGLGMGRCVELEGRFTCGQMALSKPANRVKRNVHVWACAICSQCAAAARAKACGGWEH